MSLLKRLGKRLKLGTVGNRDSASADELGKRLKRQGTKFLETCCGLFANHGINTSDGDIESARAAVAAFQTVHVLSFILAQGYLSPAETKELSRKVLSDLTITEYARFSEYFQRYEDADVSPEALTTFAEDLGQELAGSPLGAMAGTGFAFMAREFLLRNRAIVAHTFGDTAKVEELRTAVMKIHRGSQ